jgi:predicted alpha/beta superfamily hydrolase
MFLVGRKLIYLAFSLFLLVLPIELNSQIIPAKKEVFDFFPSDHVIPRRVDVYLPPNYPNDAPYHVLYMHDGQKLSDDTTSFKGVSWSADSTLHKLIADKEVPPTILVGVWSTKSRYQEYAPMPCFSSLNDSTLARMSRFYGDFPFSDRYLNFLVTELKPLIDSRYKTSKGPEATAICGSSMGGLISLYAICRYPSVFGAAGCVSIHWPILTKVNDPKMFNNLYSWLPKKIPNDGKHKIYFDHGTVTLDSLYAPYQTKIDNLFEKVNFDPTLFESRVYENAEHNESSWKERFPSVLKFVLAGKIDN